MGITAVTRITTGPGEIRVGEGQKKGRRRRREEMEEMKEMEKKLLNEAFGSLDICH